MWGRGWPLSEGSQLEILLFFLVFCFLDKMSGGDSSHKYIGLKLMLFEKKGVKIKFKS